MSKIQLRGICQCCGREQAVIGSTMSKHGYTVKEGWFDGVCSGDKHVPMQKDRTVTDKIVEQVRQDCQKLRQREIELSNDGAKLDIIEKVVRVNGKRQTILISWDEASEYEQRNALQLTIYRIQSRIRLGESFADDLENLANEYHGKELREVNLEENKPVAIVIGEQRKLENGHIATVTSVVGARVYWTITKENGKFKGWTGSRAWRNYEIV